MHPDPAFHLHDRAAMRDFVARHPFGALFVQTAAGPRVVHLPVVWLDDDRQGRARLGLHLSARNAVAAHLDGATALFVAGGAHAYVSPGWYGLDDDQVPTWNYAAVELEGRADRLDRAGLVAQVDRLTAASEAVAGAVPPWTRERAAPARIDAMLDAIHGYSLTVTDWRGTAKMNQNKPPPARRRVADALERGGQADAAAAIRATLA